ncbi:MAG: hypothetical protein V3S02_04415 [Dehalococcoidales bacterium]
MQKSIIDSFEKNPDGSWTSIRPVSVLDSDGVEVNVSEGITFARGTLLMGMDWSKWLDRQS